LTKSHVLVVDDHEQYRSVVERTLRRAGHEVTGARDASEALQFLSTESLDLVLCDVKMPGISGLELVRQIGELQPQLPCIVITGYGGGESSVEALQAGAFWYLEKPMDQAGQDVLRRLAHQAIEHGRLKAENRRLQSQLQGRYRFDNIIGTSPALKQVLDVIERVAETDSTVLITGESGTGKELAARALHYNSPRCDRSFVTVNCGAIPEQLLESELFGHVKGAFTNAVSQREGRFSAADRGTIFLDEIGDMSPNLQVKLLRVLQDRTFEPVGSSSTSEDLYYRLNVIPIEMPPLRVRGEDVPILAQHFLERICEDKSLGPCSLSPESRERLASHDWPGNVRELENLMERLIVLKGQGEIGVHELPSHIRAATDTPQPGAPSIPETGLSFHEVVGNFEADLIAKALEKTHWNKNQAAQLLHMNRTTLLEKIKKKGLQPDS
jgi:DNA-binding NtrC family response regulator